MLAHHLAMTSLSFSVDLVKIKSGVPSIHKKRLICKWMYIFNENHIR